MPTTLNLARRLRRSDGLLPGFDTMRALLVLGLVTVQSIEVSASSGIFVATPLWILGLAIPGAIFALAGYALATSARDLAPKVFMMRRLLDLGPLAIVAILFAALAIGPAATELSWRSYFTDSDFWLFAPNILALQAARLPGVFEFNNIPWVVNANYWMILTTLVGSGMLAIATQARWRSWALLGSVALLLVVTLWVALVAGNRSDAAPPAIALAASACFLCGAVAAHIPGRIPASTFLALLAAAAMGVVAVFGNFRWEDSALVALASAPLVAYLTLYTALRPLPLGRLAQRSWPLLSGLPLLAYPVQQLWVARGAATPSIWLNLAIAVGPAMLLSVGAHVLFRRIIAFRWAPELAGGGRALTPAPHRATDWRAVWRNRPTLGTLSTRAGAILPRLIGFAFFVLLVLAAMALLLLAMQRDDAGI